MSRVVLLNGVSSVGKGSVAQALQRIASRPMLHVQMDAFLEMMPPGSFGDPQGYTFETRQEHGRPVTRPISPTIGAASPGTTLPPSAFTRPWR